jgi:hypothetical protein
VVTGKDLPVQQALDLDLAAAGAAPVKRSTADRVPRSIQSMIDLAVERRYANDVGDLLDQVAAVRGQRLFNALLAVLQRPHADYLLTPAEWASRYRRTIRPNEQPIVLLVPFGPVTFCFDVSQTEETEHSRKLPAGLLNPYAMPDVPAAREALSWLTSNARHDGVRVTHARHGLRSAGCIRHAHEGVAQSIDARDRRVPTAQVAVRYDVLLNEAYSETERLSTLAHELGHLFCGHLGASTTDWWPNRRQSEHAVSEFEAESVARLVFRRIAPGVNLPPHLDQYFSEQDPIPTDGWEHVVAAADRVIDMARGRSPRKS